ncbi:hypothetical protein Tco_0053917 [Tanacetum coccineum]
MFTKQSILGKPPSSSYKPKLYFVTPFPKSSVLPKVDKTNALSKPVTSNSAPSTRESKGVNNTAKTISPQPARNAKSEVVCAMCKQCFVTGNHDVCMLNYVNDMNSRADNQSANVSKLEKSKIHKANVRKSKGSVRFSALYLKKKRNLLVFTSVDMIVMTSMVELESLFGHLFDELSNGENQVVSKSSAVTTADASDKCQQQQDSTSSTSTLATTITADGNFDL